MKRLITEQDVREYAGQTPIYVTSDVLITPAAVDAAMARGITVLYQREGGPPAPPGRLSPAPRTPLVAREDRPEAFRAAAGLGTPIPSAGGLSVTVQLPPGKDRTYVVKVSSEGVRVFESTEEGLKPLS